MVVDAEVTGTNKTTRKSEGNSVLTKEKRDKKIAKKDLTGPTLLEISGYPRGPIVNQETEGARSTLSA